MDMVDPQPTLVEFLVRHVLLPRELLPQIEINSEDFMTVFLLSLTSFAPVGVKSKGGVSWLTVSVLWSDISYTRGLASSA
jgi:hypothetical protein